jgi:hypothetical protein
LVSLRPTLLKYFHDSVLSGLWVPLISSRKSRGKSFDRVHRRYLCQRVKPAQNTRVGLHSASLVSETMERLFAHFMGPLTRSKRGNIAILVVLDAFSKFVSFFPVRKISSQIVCVCLERAFFSCLLYGRVNND